MVVFVLSSFCFVCFVFLCQCMCFCCFNIKNKLVVVLLLCCFSCVLFAFVVCWFVAVCIIEQHIGLFSFDVVVVVVIIVVVVVVVLVQSVLFIVLWVCNVFVSVVVSFMFVGGSCIFLFWEQANITPKAAVFGCRHPFAKTF